RGLAAMMRKNDRAFLSSVLCPLSSVPLPTSSVLCRSSRSGVVAMEFAIVASLLFTLLLGMIEFGRAMMVLNVVSNAARAGARAGALSSGNYTSATSAAGAVLTAAGITATPTYTVTVNNVPVTSDAAFQLAAVSGSAVS